MRVVHAELELKVVEVDAAGCSAALLNGKVDLALCYDLGLPDEVAATAVHGARPYLALPPTHRFAQREEVALMEMVDEPFVLLDLPHTRDLMLSLLSDAGLDPNVRFRSGSYETVRTFVANGHGYSILHQRPRHDFTYDGGRVTPVSIKGKVPELQTAIARLRIQRPTARTRAVAQAVRKQVASLTIEAPGLLG